MSGKSPRKCSYRLSFGRFLNFDTMVLNAETLPKNLTERRFCSYWEQTIGANVRERFTLVEHLMAENLVLATRKGSFIADNASIARMSSICSDLISSVGSNALIWSWVTQPHFLAPRISS
jgi:hypothetical protein